MMLLKTNNYNQMKSLKFSLIILFFVIISAHQSQSQKVTKNALQTFFTYQENNEIVISAHRGGKGYAGYPENCLETMQYIKNHIPNAVFEVDIAKSKDGVLLLMHDYSLERTTTGFGKVNESTWQTLSELKLKDDFDTHVDYTIPLFKDVLDWAKKENVILTVDIKRSIEPEEVLQFIEENEALQQSVIITYSIETAQRLYALNPEVVLSVSIRNMEELNRAAKSGIPWENMVAFTGTMESSRELYNALHKKGVMCMLGTLGNLDKKAAAKGNHLYNEWAKLGIDIFATDRPLQVYEAISNPK
jgi:glycerophosphoryl diester phosphodiesterase